MIHFKYRLSDELVRLSQSTIVDFNSTVIPGLVDPGLVGQLNHCSLYMICQLDFKDTTQVWKNPMAVVGRNDVDAMESYVRDTKNEDGAILCEITNNCQNIKVIPE